ncbi:MAG: hypothetical protein AB7U73_17780 [Pirellulales bacterium]
MSLMLSRRAKLGLTQFAGFESNAAGLEEEGSCRRTDGDTSATSRFNLRTANATTSRAAGSTLAAVKLML